MDHQRITVLSGSLKALDASVPGTPFSPSRIRLLASLSRSILTNSALRKDAAAVSLAFFLRAAHLSGMAETYRRRDQRTTITVPVGRVFHIAPSNVDTVFVYSWALSFLSGNANIVRLSAERSPLTEQLLSVLSDVLGTFGKENAFVTYPHDDEITEYVSSWCTHRVIWGGDETVKKIRSIPLPTYASERAFATKFSYAVIDTRAYVALSEKEKGSLAERFYADMFWFDQMACSSPHVVFWVGGRPPVPIFTGHLVRVVERHGRKVSDALAMKRISYAFDVAAGGLATVDLTSPELVSMEVDAANVTRETCGGGVLRHVGVGFVSDIAAFARPTDQTVTYFGLKKSAILRLAKQANGIDRIVPIGSALEFSTSWDGYDLLSDFVRRVGIKG